MDNEQLMIALKLLSVVALVGANGFFVATEFSLVSVRRSRIESLVAEGNTRARAVLNALKDLDGYIAATQLGITISSIGLGWIGEPALAALLDPVFEEFLPASAAIVTAHTVAFAVAFSIITILHVVFGELAPKSVALQYAERTSLIVAAPATIFLRIFRPIIFMMNGLGWGFLRLVGMERADPHHQIYTEEELQLIITASTEGGELVGSEEEIIQRAFVFHDQAAEEIMVPRTELVTLPDTATLEDLRNLIVEHSYSRFPVYQGDRNEIVGILYVRDVLPFLIGTERSGAVHLRDLMRPVHAVPASIRIDDLLEDLKRERTHAAIVIDEYGATAGMVTLEDIMERLVGDIPDEFGQSTHQIVQDGDGVTHVSGLLPLQKINDYFQLDITPDGHTRTIGGYLFSELGKRPLVGDKVQIGPYDVRVERLDGLRVAELSFIRREDDEAQSLTMVGEREPTDHGAED